MMRALYSAATGMMAQEMQIDTISNNLANVNTTGYKKVRVDFQDLIYQTMRNAGTPTSAGTEIPNPIQVGLGTKVASTQRIFSSGEYEQTDNPLDMLIEGDGFFQITMPDGTIAYTRDGSFKRDSQGKVVTSDGYSLSPEITIPSTATAINISSDGTVSVTTSGSTTPQNIGQLTLAKFINPGGLESMGKNLFRPTAASGEAITNTPGLEGFGTIAQGFLEMSNVQVVSELVNMITAQRAYEVNSKAIKVVDEMLQTANSIVT
jgi:flagellar basal-body rod protein FlgG